MDLESNTGDAFGLGLVGESNASNINMPQKSPIKAFAPNLKQPVVEALSPTPGPSKVKFRLVN